LPVTPLGVFHSVIAPLHTHTAVNINVEVSWVVTPCALVDSLHTDVRTDLLAPIYQTGLTARTF